MHRNHVEAQNARSSRKRKLVLFVKRGDVEVCQLTLSVRYRAEPLPLKGAPRSYQCNFCGGWHRGERLKRRANAAQSRRQALDELTAESERLGLYGNEQSEKP